MIVLEGKREGLLRALPWLLFWAGCTLVVLGFVANKMWVDIPLAESGLLGLLAFAAALIAWTMNRLAGWSLASSAGAVWLLALIYFAGIAPFGAIVLLALAAMALGSLFIPAGCVGRGTLSILLGMALISGVIGWLLPFPVHYRVVYVIALLVLVAVRRHVVSELLRQAPAAWRAAVAAMPSGMWLAVMAVGIITTCAWFPTVHYDDLAYHLGLPSQLVGLGYYKMDVASNLWAVAAWAGDVLQAVAWLVAGHESRGMLDALWLLLTLVLIWRLCELLDLPPWLRCLGVALYASLPLTAETLGGMQTEGPTAAVAVGIALLIQCSPKPDRRQLMAFTLLFGLLLALKISNLMIAGPLGLWLLCRWHTRLPWRMMPVALLLLLLVAGSSYTYSWILTGNPVLPIFNGIFHSPDYPSVNFHDHSWDAGFHWNIMWNIVFHSSRYIEGNNGTAGFILIALGGSLLVALFEKRTRPLALVALGAFLLPLTQIQYLRYPHPALALMIPAMLCGVPALVSGSRREHWVAGALVALVIANLIFVSAASWQLNHGELKQYLTDSSQTFMARYAPIYRIIDVVNNRYGPHARVLIASAAVPYAADFAGKAYVVGWYDQQLTAMARQADKDRPGAAWVRLLDKTGVNLLVLQSGHVPAALAAGLAAAHGNFILQAGDLQLWTVPHAIAGTVMPGPPGTLNLKFDVSTLPAQATLATARLLLRCKPSDTQVALSWTVIRQDADPWSYSQWVDCLPNGMARAALDVAVPQPITNFTVSARPRTEAADVKLGLISSRLEVRRNFGAQRDLANHLRQGVWLALARWIDPWSQKGIMHPGTPVLLSSADGVVVDFDTTKMPFSAALTHATIDLGCRYSATPIVVGWKVVEQGEAPNLSYAWAMCGRDGLAHASFDADAGRRITSFEVTAVPKDGADLDLRLLSAKSGYLASAGMQGSANRARIQIAKWLTPVPDVSMAGL